ncbi:hypothetical protein L1887_00878 [Cichorium endivia]|nr:hypothetical protein L1887_00878 [Cichorium endivia]
MCRLNKAENSHCYSLFILLLFFTILHLIYPFLHCLETTFTTLDNYLPIQLMKSWRLLRVWWVIFVGLWRKKCYRDKFNHAYNLVES